MISHKILSIGLFAVLLLVAAIQVLPYGKINDVVIPDSRGIAFEQGSWEQVVQKAKSGKKPIFLDVYATWCGPCKLLRTVTFPNKKLGAYYNEHFVNVSIDAETPEGRKIANLYGVSAYPSLLYLDSDGTVIAGATGCQYPGKLLEIGKAAYENFSP